MSTELNKELRERQSILGQIEKQYFVPNHEVPADYFANMEDAFFLKLKEEYMPKAAKSISFWEKTRVSYSIAAMTAFAILGFGMFSLLRKNDANNLSQNEVVKYLQEEDEIPTVELNTNKSILNMNELTQEDIKKYLMENEGIDVSNIN